jgi:hypothetical protein
MEKETSCINSRAILDYVKEHNNGDCSALLENLDPEIDAISDSEGFLRDPNNWISSDVVTNLYKRASAIFRDEMLAYKIGKYAVENTSLGYGQRIIVKALWSSKKALKNIQKLNDKWNRTRKVELVKMEKNEAVVRQIWFQHMAVTKDICLYTQGVYTFMPLIWGGEPLTLEEKCCYFEGAPYCEYHLKWPARNRLHEILSRFTTSKSVLTETIQEMEEDKKVIEQWS